MRNFGSTNPHGTAFAPNQWLYQKEATGIESSKLYIALVCADTVLTSAWTKPMVISKGSYGHGESIWIGSAEIPHICKRGTMGIGWAEISHISILGPILSPMKRGTLLPHSGKYGVCTDVGNTFLESPCP